MSTASNKPAVAQAAPQTTPQATPQTTPQTAPQTAPPEAYAAFIRLYIEWMEKEESEQVDLVEKSVRLAQKAHTGYTSVFPANGPFGKRGSTLYEIEFDEYVNEVWVDFKKNCNDVDKFAVHLQKDFERRLTQRKKFMDEMEAEFQKIESAIQNMSDDEADKYLNEQEQKLRAKIEKRRKEWDINYPSLEKSLRKPAERIFSRKLYDLKKRQRIIPLDDTGDENGDKAPVEIEDINVNGLSVEEELTVQDTIDRTMITLNDQDKRILVLKMSGYRNTEIAKELGIRDSTVSNRMKKIQSKLSNQLNIP